MSGMPLGIAMAFASALTFVGQNFWLRELQTREGPWRYSFLVNAAPIMGGLLWWLFFPPSLSWRLVIGSFYVSAPAIAGMLLLGLAVYYGDISHVGSVIGAKPLIVTALGAALGFETVTRDFWAASGLLLLALFLITGSREVLRRPWRLLEKNLLLAVGFCVSYGLSDLITRQQMADHGLDPFDFIIMNWIVRAGLTGGVVAAHCLRRRERFWPSRLSTVVWTLPATFLHGFAFTAALKFTNSAILTNVLVSIRGFLAVIAVAVLGRWGLVRREPMTRAVLFARIVGSLLVCLAVWLGLRAGLRPR